MGPIAAVGAEIVFVADVAISSSATHQSGIASRVVKVPDPPVVPRDADARTTSASCTRHKDAGMEHTINRRCATDGGAGEPRTRRTGPTSRTRRTTDDPPVVVLHLLRFVDGGHPGHDELHPTREQGGGPHGVRIAGWFGIEGTIVGDGRPWDQVRFNAFPSREAFMAVVFDPERLAAHKGHREPAIADTYTLILRADDRPARGVDHSVTVARLSIPAYPATSALPMLQTDGRFFLPGGQQWARRAPGTTFSNGISRRRPSTIRRPRRPRTTTTAGTRTPRWDCGSRAATW